ncbi:VOC family protein [Actinomycetota bacterium]
MSTHNLFSCLSYRDVEGAVAFLIALGFTERALHRDESDPTRVVHAEFAWGEGGGVMFATASDDPDETFRLGAGTGNVYVTVPSDADVDRAYAAALAAGGTSVREPEDQDYGGRSASVADPEGNLFSVGSYQGAPDA